MSIRETAMVVTYWKRIGGTLIEEYLLTKQETNVGRRRADGVILVDGPTKRMKPQTPESLEGREVIVLQAKIGRLGMYLLGQAFFSKLLAERLGAASVRSIIIHFASPVIRYHPYFVLTIRSTCSGEYHVFAPSVSRISILSEYIPPTDQP